MSTRAEFRLLGPVEMGLDGRVWEVGPPQRRHALAALLVDVGRPVPVETLLDRVWDTPPPGARRALQVHLTQLRRLLERAGGAHTLVRRSGGYLLEADPDQVDLHRFTRLAATGGVAALREARALWRGEPLTGLTGGWVEQCRASWRQRYAELTADWAEAELAGGNHAALIGPLREAAGAYPLNEPLAAALMRALHAAGRPAEALEHYAAVSRRLADDLGVHPSAELQAVHRAVLGAEPPTATRADVPAQLPADAPGFAGRAEHLARLDALLTRDGGRTVVISAVSGTPGVGKTALAVHWAHSVADRFPDGQLYVNLRGFDPVGRATDPADALRGFLEALGVPAARIPSTPDAMAALYRSELSGRRMLVLLDNARDAEQVRPLLPGTPSAVVVVTSRNQLTGLLATDGAHPLTLDVLSRGESLDLLRRRLGPARVAAEPQAVRSIIESCARLPLALGVAAARARQTGFPLDAIARELSEAGGKLDALDTGDPAGDVRAVFSTSYAALGAGAARLFRLLGVHPGADIGVPAAAALAGSPVPETRRLLTELVRASLLTEHVPGRYAFHDLLRAYAADLVSPDAAEALDRLIAFYLHTAYAADRLLDPLRIPIPVPLGPPPPGVPVRPVAGHDDAMAWFHAEHPTLLAAARTAAETGRDAAAWQLHYCLETFLYRQGHWHDQAVGWALVLPGAERLGNPVAVADTHRALALAATRLGRYPEAHAAFGRSLAVSESIGDLSGQARTHYSLAWLNERQGNLDRGLHHAQECLSLHQRTGYRREQAKALNAVGWYQAQIGDHSAALLSCRDSLTIMQELGDREGQAAVWDSLGLAHRHLGQIPEALECYAQSCAAYRDINDRYGEAVTLNFQGDAHLDGGDPESARRVWTLARALLDELHHPMSKQLQEKLDNL